MKKKNINLLFGVVMLVALIGGLILVKQNQDSRRGAYFAGTKLFLLPAERTANLGDSVPIEFWLETDSGARISSADVTVCYDAHLNLDSSDLESQISLNSEVVQDLIVAEMRSDPYPSGSKNCVRLVSISNPTTKPEDLKSGVIKLLTIRFTAVGEGSGEVIIDGASAKIGGYNPAPGATDSALKVGTITGAKYTITGSGECRNLWWFDDTSLVCQLKEFCGVYMYPGLRTFETEEECMQALPTSTPIPTFGPTLVPTFGPTLVPTVRPTLVPTVRPTLIPTLRPTFGPTLVPTVAPTLTPPITDNWPVLNYSVLYAFVKTNDSQCFVPSNWPLQIEVRAEGENRLYTNVVPQIIGDVDGFVKLGGSLVLEGFNKTENVAAFMKGPKHLQMKYAVDRQSGRYNNEGGELSLLRLSDSNSYSALRVYDFTLYPILSGDVRGKDSDEPDGIVNGYDWVEIKNRARVLETVESGGYLKWDLDGSCQVNSNDLYQIRKTLEEKQGELY